MPEELPVVPSEPVLLLLGLLVLATELPLGDVVLEPAPVDPVVLVELLPKPEVEPTEPVAPLMPVDPVVPLIEPVPLLRPLVLLRLWLLLSETIEPRPISFTLPTFCPSLPTTSLPMRSLAVSRWSSSDCSTRLMLAEPDMLPVLLRLPVEDDG